jgi:hypothetical protein
MKIFELLLFLAAAVIILIQTFRGCCADYDVLAFNFLFFFVCILIAIPFLYFLGRTIASAKNVTLISFSILVLVFLVSLFMYLSIIFQEPLGQYFGFDTSHWIRRGIRKSLITKPEVRSGAGLAIITWCLIGTFFLTRYLRKPK